MKSVHIVMGATGEYGDYQEWVAFVCTNKRVADSICKKLNKIAGGYRSRSIGREAQDKIRADLLKAGDDAACVDYTGTAYESYGPVPLTNSSKLNG